MADLIQIRRDKGSVWQSVNPTLALAEIGIVLDDNGAMTNPIQFKVGNGSTAWNNLPMQNGSAINKIKVNGVELTIDGNRAVDVIVKASGSLGTDVSGSTVAFVDSTGVVRNSSVNIANTSGSSTSSLITQAAVSESIADVRKDIDLLSGSVSGSFAAVDERVTGIEENIENNYAKIDGSYDSMAVGVAKNLEGDQEVEDTFISRTAGGTAEIANGVAQILEVKGNSVVWNQLVEATKSHTANGVHFEKNGNFIKVYTDTDGATATTIYTDVLGGGKQWSDVAIVGHKYSMSGCPNGGSLDSFHMSCYSSNVWQGEKFDTGNGVVFSVTDSVPDGYPRITINKGTIITTPIYFRPQLVDLTLLGIDNLTTVEEVEAWLAENIGPFEYYPYNAGTVLNNSMEGIETTGFNLLDPATGKAQILGAYDDASGNLYGITGTHGTITFKAADGTEETVTPDADGKFQLTVPGELTVANAGADCAVFLWRDGSKTDYEEYDRNVSYLDVKNIYGKLNGSGSLVQVFPDGMAGVNGVKDVLHVKDGKAVVDKKVGVVDLGTLNYSYLNQEQVGLLFYSPLGLPAINDNSKPICICGKYLAVGAGTIYSDRSADKVVTIEDGNKVKIKDSAYTDASTFKTAMSGVKLYYELATPQHYTDLVYINSSHFADNTPVALPVTYTVNNWGIENILPKNTSENVSTAPADLLCRYAMDAIAQLNAHSNQIEDLYEVKANKEGTYPGLVAGNLVDTSGVGTEQQFVFRHTGGEEHVADKTQAVIQKYMGKSLVWNQLINYIAPQVSGDTANLTCTREADGRYKIVLSAQVTELSNIVFAPIVSKGVRTGHKYITKYGESDNLAPHIGYSGGNGVWWQWTPTGLAPLDSIATSGETTDLYGTFYIGSSLPAGTYYILPTLFDLTQMFGAGNEPSTVEEFEALFPQPYYEYNEGTIISNNVDSIETVGFNQWDEEWENRMFVTAGGVPVSRANAIGSRNYCEILPGKTYFAKISAKSRDANVAIFFYDAQKNFIERIISYGGEFTTPANAAYFRMYWEQVDTVASYNHDFCINISDPAKNGTYEPYEKHSIQIGLGEFQVKDSEGSVITVNGLKSAGSVYDEIDPVRKKYIKRVGEVDLGSLNFNYNSDIYIQNLSSQIPNIKALSSNTVVANILIPTYITKSAGDGDTDTSGSKIIYQVGDGYIFFKNSGFEQSDIVGGKIAKLEGQYLFYELATPEEYDLVKSIPEAYPAFGVGTEAIEPSGVNEETGVPKTTPFRAVIFYSKDYISQLNNMPRDYISAGSMTNFYTELASKLGAAISKSISVSASFNSSDQKYDYVITISDISGSI